MYGSLSTEDNVQYFPWSQFQQEVVFYRGTGCSECKGTGYLGRIAIHEIFIINEEIRELIAKGSSILEIQASTQKYGFRSMRYDGLKKALRGLTTLEEIDRVTTLEEDLWQNIAKCLTCIASSPTKIKHSITTIHNLEGRTTDNAHALPL